MDDLVNFEEITVKEVAEANEKFFDSKGKEMGNKFWETMMNHMTNERLPDRQFGLITESLSLKIKRKSQMSKEEIRLMEEINKGKINLLRLEKQLEQISIGDEISDEEITVKPTVTIDITEVSDECVTEDGHAIKIIYAKEDKMKGYYLKF
jgi:hypothetical protein